MHACCFKTLVSVPCATSDSGCLLHLTVRSELGRRGCVWFDIVKPDEGYAYVACSRARRHEVLSCFCCCCMLLLLSPLLLPAASLLLLLLLSCCWHPAAAACYMCSSRVHLACCSLSSTGATSLLLLLLSHASMHSRPCMPPSHGLNHSLLTLPSALPLSCAKMQRQGWKDSEDEGQLLLSLSPRVTTCLTSASVCGPCQMTCALCCLPGLLQEHELGESSQTSALASTTKGSVQMVQTTSIRPSAPSPT